MHFIFAMNVRNKYSIRPAFNILEPTQLTRSFKLGHRRENTGCPVSDEQSLFHSISF